MRERLASVRSLIDIPLAVVIALLLYIGVIYLIVPYLHVIPVARERMVEMKEFLDDQANADATGAVYVLGSSVVIEGIDCHRIDPLLPRGYTSYNLGWTGASPHAWPLILGPLRQAAPAAVVLCVDIGDFPVAAPIASDLLTIASWWRLVPKETGAQFSDLLSKHERDTLTASRLRDLIEFRQFPMDAFDAYIRETSRPDLRYEGYAANFKAPWVRRKCVSPEAMARGIRQRAARLARGSGHELADRARELKAIVEYLGTGQSTVSLVLTPIHPEVLAEMDASLREETVARLQEVARDSGATLIDYTELLPPECFSDQVHPFDRGRAILSDAVGRAIAETLSGRS